MRGPWGMYVHSTREIEVGREITERSNIDNTKKEKRENKCSKKSRYRANMLRIMTH